MSLGYLTLLFKCNNKFFVLSGLKKLAGETVIYGASSIVARLINWFITPIYTYNFPPSQFGIFTNLLAYIAFIQVLLTFGMETSYFRFASRSKEPEKVFGTAIISLLISSVIFMILIFTFTSDIAKLINYQDHENYIIWLGITLALDTMSAIPFAKLRFQSRPIKFAAIKITNIFINIFLNFFWIIFCPWWLSSHPDSFIRYVYSDQIGIGYAFIAYLISSAVTLLLFLPDFKPKNLIFRRSIFTEMFRYGWPILIIGLAGMVNTNIEKILIPWLDHSANPDAELGIYGANAKLAILMNLFIQAFRFSFEPFLFSHYKNENSKVTYARVMKYFVILGLLIFLGVMFYMDIIKHFIGKSDSDYITGLKVVPWLLMGNLFLGIFYTQSLWYKLTDQTHFGARFAIIGAIITLVINILFIPKLGYMAAGYAFFISSFVMTVHSYILGQKYFPVRYNLVRIASYFGVAMALFTASYFLSLQNEIVKLTVNSMLFLVFIGFIWYKERSDLERLMKRG
jgi:O-antigen/teichoic acid export membrane protein